MKSLLILTLLTALAMDMATGLTNNGFELDGDATSSTVDDWDTLYGGGGSAKSYSGVKSDPAPLSTFRTGGSKDTNDISSWKHGDSSVPDKDDILNSYAASYVDNGKVYIYFGADRYSNSGDAAAGFWFFQDNVQALDNGQFFGLHQDGDILVVANFGSTQEITVYEWLSGSMVQIFSDANAECNSALNQTVCAITNSADTPAPWPYTPKDGVAGTFPHTSFVEGGVNLNELFGSITSIPCFTSFMAVTRSSTSLNAQLKDFVLNEFKLCSIGGSISCDSAAINPSKTGVVYGYSLQVENDGFGDLYNLTVEYGGQTVHTQATLSAGEIVTINGTFDDDGTSPQPVTTTGAFFRAYQTPDLALDGVFEVNLDPASCPLIDLVPDATIVATCDGVAIDEVAEKYVYNYSVTVNNTGFGNLTFYEFAAYAGEATGSLLDLLTSFLGNVLTPTGSTRSASTSGSLESDVPQTAVTGFVNFLTFNGSNLERTDVSNTCPTVTINPNIAINKTCDVGLEVFGDKVVVYANYSGTVCNNGNIRLKNVEVHEQVVGLSDELIYSAASMDKNTCADFSGSYYPPSFDHTYDFSDTVATYADVILNLGNVTDSANAVCNLCP